MKIALFLAAALIAAPVAATPVYKNVEIGMTTNDVISLYPLANQKRDRFIIEDRELVPGCVTNVDINLQNGVVAGVTFSAGPGSSGRCIKLIQRTLTTRQAAL